MTKSRAVAKKALPVVKTKKTVSKRPVESDMSEVESVDAGELDMDVQVYSEDENNANGEVSDEELMESKSRLKEAQKYLKDLTAQTKKRSKVQSRVDEDEEDADTDNENELDFGEIDAEEIDREIIASRLKKDTLISRGKMFEAVANSYKEFFEQQGNDVGSQFVRTADGKVPTGAVISADGKVAYVITKGNSIVQYAVDPVDGSMKKLHVFKTESPKSKNKNNKKTGQEKVDSFASIAVTTCGGYLAAGSVNGKILIWSVKPGASGTFNYKFETTFTQHRGAILGLAFQRDTLTLYSCSADRTVKIWSLEQMAYVDTLYGHQDVIPAIATLCKEQCLTIGCRDRTARLWKIVEETQLVFRAVEAAGGNQDCLAMLDEESFVTGSDEGALSLWSITKKKPTATQFQAHKTEITAIAALPFTDLVVTGAGDGFVRFWRCSPSDRVIQKVGELAVEGFVNGLHWSENGTVLVVAAGKEGRLGRWKVIKEAKNSLYAFKFPKFLNQ